MVNECLHLPDADLLLATPPRSRASACSRENPGWRMHLRLRRFLGLYKSAALLVLDRNIEVDWCRLNWCILRHLLFLCLSARSFTLSSILPTADGHLSTLCYSRVALADLSLIFIHRPLPWHRHPARQSLRMVYPSVGNGSHGPLLLYSRDSCRGCRHLLSRPRELQPRV